MPNFIVSLPRRHGTTVSFETRLSFFSSMDRFQTDFERLILRHLDSRLLVCVSFIAVDS